MHTSPALHKWLNALPSRAIRLIESPQSSRLASGRVLRGVQLGTDMCLARDRRFYRINTPDGVAAPLTDDEVLSLYCVERLQKMFQLATREIRRARRTPRAARNSGPACPLASD